MVKIFSIKCRNYMNQIDIFPVFSFMKNHCTFKTEIYEMNINILCYTYTAFCSYFLNYMFQKLQINSEFNSIFQSQDGSYFSTFSQSVDPHNCMNTLLHQLGKLKGCTEKLSEHFIRTDLHFNTDNTARYQYTN